MLGVGQGKNGITRGRPVGINGIPLMAIPEIVLGERHSREVGIGADGANGHGLLHAEDAGLFHHLCAHDQIVVEELAGSLTVGAYVAHDACRVDHDMRPSVLEEADDSCVVPQIIIAAARATTSPHHSATRRRFTTQDLRSPALTVTARLLVKSSTFTSFG